MILLIALVVVLVLAAAFLVFLGLRPAEFRISREAVIAAPAAELFRRVVDFHEWDHGTPGTVGSRFLWEGNNQVGTGGMTLRESRAPERILIDLEFTRPMKALNLTEFTFTPASGGIRVTWTMTGRHNLMGKAFSAVVDMDKMVGGQFEKGLENLRSVAAGGTRIH